MMLAAELIRRRRQGTNRLVNYARGTLSPIIKQEFLVDPNQGLAKGLLKKGTETAVDIGSWYLDISGGIKVREAISINLEEVLPQTDMSKVLLFLVLVYMTLQDQKVSLS